jgi:uncharacterized protein with von Willebrand factor type A (vWA) domain
VSETSTGLELVELLVGFARRLRDEGVAVGPGDTEVYCATAAALDPTDLVDLFWAGRVSLVTRRDDLPVYDRVFRSYFLGADDHRPPFVPLTPQRINELEATIQVPEAEEGETEREMEQAELGLVGSDISVTRGKAFATCTPEELAELRRVIATMRLMPPRRRTRRRVPARRRGAPDLRRTVRDAMRHHGESDRLLLRRKKLRLRKLVLILDVSGSMTDYSRNLLQFAHSTKRACDRVEVFCFGTRLTRITRDLEHRSPDAALARAAESVFDWAGGTRIGECLDTFVRDWGRRGMSRGGIVVICSDGLDRGDPKVLEDAMARLRRLSHAIVWVDPDLGAAAGAPTSLGMMVAMPYVDRLLSGHDLAGLAELAETLPQLG